jgi:hypothetical protein
VETWTLEESGLTGYSVYGDLYSVAYDEQRDVYLAVGVFDGYIGGEWYSWPVILRKWGNDSHNPWEPLTRDFDNRSFLEFRSIVFGNGRFVCAGPYSVGVTP